MVKSVSKDEEYLNLLPSKWWKNFFKKFDEIDDTPNSQWKSVHQLAYLTRRYEKTYGKRFSFSLTGRPGKCPEMFMINKLPAMLGTSNQRTIREYIDWVFDNKIIANNARIRSVGFFANASFCNEFQLDTVDRDKVNRSTIISKEYREVISSLDLPIETYGDLAFAKQALDENPDSESRKPYKVMFNKLYSIGFEYDMIKGLK